MVDKIEHTKPHYTAPGVAVWVNTKNGKPYLSIKVVGHNTIYAFQNNDKVQSE